MTTTATPCAGSHPAATVGVDRRLRARRGLLAVTVGATVLEAVLLLVLGLRGSEGIAAQVAAPAPFGVFHDLRWLLVYHHSWLSFALEASAVWLARSTLSTVIVRLAWVDPASRPAYPTLFRRSLVFTLVCAVLLTPFTGLMFGLAVASVSWLFFAAVPSVLAIALLVGHGVATRRWYAHRPPLRTVGWLALSFPVLSLSGAAMTACPTWLVVPVAVLAGLFDAWAWYGVVSAIESRDVPRRLLPVAPLGLAAFAVVIVVGTAIGFSSARVTPQPGDVTQRQPLPPGHPVMVVSGFGTPWAGARTHFLGTGFAEWRYSYAGMTADGVPLPYAGKQTYQPLRLLVRQMAAQVTAFHQETGRPVSIVAESEGALVAKTYLAATPDAPVDRLVLLSPLVAPARVYYPPAGQQGWGLAGGWELRGISATIHALGSEEINGDSPFLRSLDDHAAALRPLLGCPLPPTQQLAIRPLADATSTPYATRLDIPSAVVPGFHGGLMGERSVERLVAAYLSTGQLPPADGLGVAQKAIQAASAAWQVPELPLGVNPAWHDVSGDAGCDTSRQLLHTWVYGGAPSALSDGST